MNYAIGDIHGCFDTLMLMLKEIGEYDNIYLVGDLIDRGLKSRQVLDFVINNPKIHSVLGNHEDLMIDFGEKIIVKYNDDSESPIYIDDWMRNGGIATLFSYDLIKRVGSTYFLKKNDNMFDIFCKHIEEIKKFPLYINTGIKKDDREIIISHSSVSHVWYLKNDQSRYSYFYESITWNRTQPKNIDNVFNIFGHTPVSDVDSNKYFSNIDTGCCYSRSEYGKLSSICLETDKVIQVFNIG